MAIKTTGRLLFITVLGMAMAPVAAPANDDASAVPGATPPIEASAAGAPTAQPIDPIVPPVKRVIPVTPAFKAPAAKKTAVPTKTPATDKPTKAADNAKPAPSSTPGAAKKP